MLPLATSSAPDSGSPPTRVFLDNQQLNYLVDPEATIGIERAVLDGAILRGQVEIVGSLELMQEAVATGRTNRAKGLAMLNALRDLAGARILLPLRERHVAEAHFGGMLPARLVHLNRPDRRDLFAFARRQRNVLAVADQAYLEGREFSDQERRMRDRAEQDLHAAGQPASPELLRAWLAVVDLDEWASGPVSSGVEQKLYEVEAGTLATYDRFPSVWIFMAYRLARVVKTLGDGRRIDPSDLADAQHVSAGAYYDLLVTDDRQLTDTLELSPERFPFRWSDSAGFNMRFSGSCRA